MKTTFKEILTAKGGMQKLMELKLKPAQAIALARLVKKLDEELTLFQKEQLKLKRPDPDNLEESQLYEKELEELLDVTVEIDGDKVTLTVREIDAHTVLSTEPFVTFEEGE